VLPLFAPHSTTAVSQGLAAAAVAQLRAKDNEHSYSVSEMAAKEFELRGIYSKLVGTFPVVCAMPVTFH
jgi:hypothetical protein